MTKTTGVLLVMGVSFLGVQSGRASSTDDDLAVVRKAVQKDSGADASKPHTKPTWLHVRVEGKKENKERVSINIPFAVVEAFGDQDLCHTVFKGGDHKSIHLADVLKTFESGQQLVEVDNDEETVKIWLE